MLFIPVNTNFLLKKAPIYILKCHGPFLEHEMAFQKQTFPYENSWPTMSSPIAAIEMPQSLTTRESRSRML